MTETFYRLHRADAPAFTADNAWSAPWGETFSTDGTRYECRTCDGTGLAYGEPCADSCDDGWLDADRGYSACHTAGDLIAYMDKQGIPADCDPVVIFDGERVGNGPDGEPLAIPTGNLRWTTYGALRTEKE